MIKKIFSLLRNKIRGYLQIYKIMAKTRKEKEDIVKNLKEKISQSNFLIFTNYQGLKVKEIENLRKMIKKHQDEYLVTKKTLLNLALAEAGLPSLNDLKIKKEIGLVLTNQNKIETVKDLFNFIKEYEKLEVKGGVLAKNFLKPEEIREISLIPSPEVLKIKLLNSFQAPILNLLNVLKSNLNGLIFLLQKIQK